MPRDCIVFVTHVWTENIALHFARLRAEARNVLDVYLAYQVADGAAVPIGVDPDIVVTTADVAARFPLRHLEAKASPRVWGYVEMVWITAFLDECLKSYDRFWLVEYDVDFSGNWATFFRAAADYEGDLLTARIRRLSDDPDFVHARNFRKPNGVANDPLIAFMPISRLSRGLIEHYRSTLERPGWQGHFELVLPTIAEIGGFRIAEIGGNDRFTPGARRGLHYDGSFRDGPRGNTTHRFRPARSYRYFASSPHAFRQKDRIYHPVKADYSLRQKLNDRYLPLLAKLRVISRRLRGKA